VIDGLLAEYSSRVAAVKAAATQAGFDVMYVGHSTDLEYLVGLPRPEPHYGRSRFFAQWAMGAIVTADAKPVVLVPRHVAEFHLGRIAADPSTFEVALIRETDDPKRAVAEAITGLVGRMPRSIGLNEDAPAELVLNLQASFPQAEISLASAVLQHQRAVKSKLEIEAIKRGCLIADRVFIESLGQINPARTEVELGKWIENRLEELRVVPGSANAAIFSMGSRERRSAAERISTRAIGVDISVNYDFGACLDQYCLDFGRTVHIGPPSARLQAAYDAVIASQEEGAKALRPGTRCSDVDRAAREVINAAGFGDYFRHRLGHGIGMDVHEAPYLDSTDDSILKGGETFTIEPSIFITGEFGVRIEDIYVVTPEGGVRLNEAGRSLLIL
jgi:Xaa-Pro dipeptidase